MPVPGDVGSHDPGEAVPDSAADPGAVDHHQRAGLVRRTVQGRTHLCRLEPRPLEDAHEWIAFYERFWTSRLDVLEGLLRQEDAAKASQGHDQ